MKVDLDLRKFPFPAGQLSTLAEREAQMNEGCIEEEKNRIERKRVEESGKVMKRKRTLI